MRVEGHEGNIDFEGQQLTVTKKRRGSSVILVSRVGGVVINKVGIGRYAIRFAVAGSSYAPRTDLGPRTRALADPYALTFPKKSLAEFEALREAVMAAAP